MIAGHKIRPETAADFDAIDQIHKDAFGPGNPVPALTRDLRQIKGTFSCISCVAEGPSGQIIGHVMATHAWLDAPKALVDVMVLSPLGVRPGFQRRGIGKALIEYVVQAATDLSVPLLFLEGDPAYYGPRGFEGAGPLGFRAPSLRIPERAFQVVKLSGYSADMTGTLVYREVFWDHDCVGLRPDS